MRKDLVQKSKFLSLVLRHKPGLAGLSLDSNGWGETALLLAQTEHPISRAELDEIVATNPKRRFELSEDGKLIRARQGHSVTVDLALPATQPPDFLFHGTATRFLEAILEEGLNPRKRHHVHLSADIETARSVGARHGKPVILRVDAKAMAQTGHIFHITENGVWLTDTVPPTALQVIT
jgi:putative RNA 2'-phosphotransferase